MSGIGRLLASAPTRADIAYFLRALLARPGDLPGILRREAARRRASLPKGRRDDPLGLAALTESWQAALAAGAFRAPRGEGPPLRVNAIGPRPLGIVSDLQWASAACWIGVETSPAFPPLSLEAARLGLRQASTDPGIARELRSGWVEAAPVSAALRDALRALADEPMGRA